MVECIFLPKNLAVSFILFNFAPSNVVCTEKLTMHTPLLHNKRGLIFGAVDEHSLAWATALACIDNGAQVVLTNTPAAIELGDISRLAASHNLPLIPCDATSPEDLERLLTEAQQLLGGKIDFVLHAVAMSQNLRRHKTYENANYHYYQQTLDTSALSLHKLLQTALRMDAISEGGSVVTLTYLASERSIMGYNDMADAKAMLESIVRNFGRIYGERKRVRINAISQSPTPTRASAGFDRMNYFYRLTDELSPLGNATAEDLADLCVVLFSDFTRKVTMQTIYNDGGFSRTALTERFAQTYSRAIDAENPAK